jgi:cell division protein FtsW
MMFAAGTRWWYLGPVATVVIGGFVGAVRLMPNRVERIMAFLDLEKFKDGLGLQQWRALIALGSGSVEGVGLGFGKQKRGFLPESVTDFIFPNIGEEFGLYGTAFVLLMFVCILVAGMIIAKNAPDRFSRLLAFGITVMIALEAIINMGVTTALLPNKGLPLPFVSYGGTNLLFAMASIGVLMNIHRHSPRAQKKLLLDTRRGGMRPATS